MLFILTDDQRWDSLDQMPLLDHRSDWARFSQAMVEEPQCCPSRAGIFTGRHTQHTGVDTLVTGFRMDDRLTVATMLHDAGYRTGFMGKYLNDYPFGRPHYVPPGWDRFEAYEGPTEYTDYSLNEQGVPREYGSNPGEYSTDVLVEKARQFIQDTDPARPFFVEVALNAPHFSGGGAPPQPPARHLRSCGSVDLPTPENYGARDKVSEPAWLAAAPSLTPEQSTGFNIFRKATCQTLAAVDEDVQALLADLERQGRLADTYVVFFSDNGFSFGEHRIQGKGHLYEESIRVPLLVRGPGVRPGPVDRLTANIDITPTILDWAGVRAPDGFLDGRSFAGRLRGEPSDEPQEVLLRGCRTRAGPATTPASPGAAATSEGGQECGGYPEDMGKNWGIRTPRYKLIEYPDGYVQLFDLQVDPYELTNRADDPGQAEVRTDLQARLARLRR